MLAILCAVVFSAVIITHWPGLSAKALFFDDDLYLTNNELVQNPGFDSGKRFLCEVFEPSTVYGYYQPLTMISLMFDHAFGGRKDYLMPFHRTSLILHAVNTVIIIYLLYSLFGHVWIAAGIGLLFGLHPMTVETIPWVGERKTLLSAFFALWSLVFYVRYCRTKNFKLYIVCALTYVLAMMAKPISLPLPVLMLLMDYWPLQRLNIRPLKELNRKPILEKLPLFILAAVFAYITIVSQARTAAITAPTEHGVGRIILTLCHNIIFYPYKMFWPMNMSSYYVFPEPLTLANPMVLAGVFGTGILIALLVISLRWTRGALTGWLIFFVAIFPTMGVVGFTIVIASDKFAYLPSIGIMMILAAFLCWLLGRLSRKNSLRLGRVLIFVTLLLASAEAIGTRKGLSHWQDTVSLCRHMISLTPKAGPLHFKLAKALSAEGKTTQASEHYKQAIKLSPREAEIYNCLGHELQLQGKIDKAINIYRQGLMVRPEHFNMRCNLADALKSKGKIDEAISHYRKALEFTARAPWDKPDYERGQLELATLLKSIGKLDEAIKLYHQILQDKPDFALAYINLGNAFSAQNNLEEAINNYRKALQLNPDNAIGHSNLAWHLKMTGRYDQSLKHFQLALNLEPEQISAALGMAQALIEQPEISQRDKKLAIELATTAMKLTKGKDRVIFETLARAYIIAGEAEKAALVITDMAFLLQKQGNLGEAIKQYQRALKIDPACTKAKTGLQTAQ